MLSCTSILPACSIRGVQKNISKQTTMASSQDDLLKRMFLVGRVQTLMVNETYTTVLAVNLWIVFFKPFHVLHYTNGEQITYVNKDSGVNLKGKGVLGSFMVMLPINSNSIAVMKTSLGTFIVELYEDKMPNTTENFIRLVNDGFYDGLVFHRVIDNFVIQGGGYYPNGTLNISPYDPIDLEIHPDVHHLDGTIGMARTNDPNSATSQFFIDDGRQRQLEPGGVDPYGYAAFGRVINGIDVVRAIAQVATTTRYGLEDWPVEDVIIEHVSLIHPTEICITDYVEDVCSVDYLTGESTIVTDSTEICVDNLDIERVTYSQVGMLINIHLQVVGNIENRGKLLDLYNSTDKIDTVQYEFQLSTSEDIYIISYSNRTGTLQLLSETGIRNLTSENFMIVGKSLSFRFYTQHPGEQFESLRFFTVYIKVNFSDPTLPFLYFTDITPNPPLKLIEIYAPHTGYVGETIQFNASIEPLSGLPPYTYLWEFGDQETSTDLNPSHIYMQPDVYTYNFTVTDAAGDTASASGVITILPPGYSIDVCCVI
jgi:cyclophilin family peptidyl-prolyl cis-trans isomerase